MSDKVIAQCGNCNKSGEATPFHADDRFLAYRCECGKVTLIPIRELEEEQDEDV